MSLTIKEIISQLWNKCKSTFAVINDDNISTTTTYSSAKTENTINNHTNNKEIHITQEERESWFNGDYNSLLDKPIYRMEEYDLMNTMSNPVNLWDYVGFDGSKTVTFLVMLKNNIVKTTLNDKDENKSDKDGIVYFTWGNLYLVTLDYRKTEAGVVSIDGSGRSNNFSILTYKYTRNTVDDKFTILPIERFIHSGNPFVDEDYIPKNRKYLVNKGYFDDNSIYEEVIGETVSETLQNNEITIDTEGYYMLVVEEATTNVNYSFLAYYLDDNKEHLLSLEYDDDLKKYVNKTNILLSGSKSIRLHLDKKGNKISGNIKYHLVKHISYKEKIDEINLTQKELWNKSNETFSTKDDIRSLPVKTLDDIQYDNDNPTDLFKYFLGDDYDTKESFQKWFILMPDDIKNFYIGNNKTQIFSSMINDMNLLFLSKSKSNKKKVAIYSIDSNSSDISFSLYQSNSDDNFDTVTSEVYLINNKNAIMDADYTPKTDVNLVTLKYLNNSLDEIKSYVDNKVSEEISKIQNAEDNEF